jgi:hypothetical protein
MNHVVRLIPFHWKVIKVLTLNRRLSSAVHASELDDSTTKELPNSNIEDDDLEHGMNPWVGLEATGDHVLAHTFGQRRH